jgi:hypothetical protein
MPSNLFQSIRTKIAEYKKNNSLPGTFKLFEYYTDRGKELINVKETEVAAGKLFWDLTFIETGKYDCATNLDIPLVSGIKPGDWSRYKNFVTLIPPGDYRESVEFQFAFDHGNLKLLKKDEFGNIIVFAFFRRIPE